jgi:hypothetical protein
MAYKIDLTTRNASIAIVLGLDVLFFAVAIGASVQPAFADLSTKLWGLFAGTNGALMLALNASGSNTPTPPPPAVVGA